MQSAREGNTVVVKLDDGEDLFASLDEVARKEGVTSGTIVAGIGMLRDAEIGFFDGNEYQNMTVEGPVELLSLLGSIAGSVHIHCILGMPDHSAIGGHLMRATVAVLNEITIQAFDEVVLDRALNPTSGLNEMTIDR
jgi:predicted DNA-binding protein with PD1-like motif